MANASDTCWQGSFYNSSLTWSDTEEKRNNQATQLHLLETGHKEGKQGSSQPGSTQQPCAMVLGGPGNYCHLDPRRGCAWKEVSGTWLQLNWCSRPQLRLQLQLRPLPRDSSQINALSLTLSGFSSSPGSQAG